MAAIRNSYLNAIKYIQINSMWRIITAHNWEVSVRNRDIHNFPRHKPIRAGPCAALQMSQRSLSSTFSSENFCLAGSTSAWWSSPTFSLTTAASLAAVPWPPGCWHVPPPTQPIDLLCNSQQQEKVSQVVKVQHLSFTLC